MLSVAAQMKEAMVDLEEGSARSQVCDFVFHLSLHTSIILEEDDHNIQALSKDNHKLRCLLLGCDQPCSYSWL